MYSPTLSSDQSILGDDGIFWGEDPMEDTESLREVTGTSGVSQGEIESFQDQERMRQEHTEVSQEETEVLRESLSARPSHMSEVNKSLNNFASHLQQLLDNQVCSVQQCSFLTSRVEQVSATLTQRLASLDKHYQDSLSKLDQVSEKLDRLTTAVSSMMGRHPLQRSFSMPHATHLSPKLENITPPMAAAKTPARSTASPVSRSACKLAVKQAASPGKPTRLSDIQKTYGDLLMKMFKIWVWYEPDYHKPTLDNIAKSRTYMKFIEAQLPDSGRPAACLEAVKRLDESGKQALFRQLNSHYSSSATSTERD